jgi:hypothetical protein
VLADVLDGFTTPGLAERDYGVVIDAETGTVDDGSTRRLRDERRGRVAGTGTGA